MKLHEMKLQRQLRKKKNGGGCKRAATGLESTDFSLEGGKRKL